MNNYNITDYVRPSHRKGKKWMVKVEGRLVHFGQAGAEDYTMHHDKERSRQYRSRHKHDHIHDENKPGFWAYWLLWSFPDIQQAFQYIMETFNPNIELV